MDEVELGPSDDDTDDELDASAAAPPIDASGAELDENIMQASPILSIITPCPSPHTHKIYTISWDHTSYVHEGV